MKVTIALWLAVALVVTAMPLPLLAGTGLGDSEASYVEAGSSEDGSLINKEFALGLFLVIVAVLLWVGFREDMGWWSGGKGGVRTAESVRPGSPHLVSLGWEGGKATAGGAVALAWDF